MTDRGGWHCFAATLDLKHSPEAVISAYGAVHVATTWGGDVPHRVVIANLRDEAAPLSSIALFLTPDQAEATGRMLMEVAQRVRAAEAPPVGAIGSTSIPTVTAWPVEARPVASEED